MTEDVVGEDGEGSACQRLETRRNQRDNICIERQQAFCTWISRLRAAGGNANIEVTDSPLSEGAALEKGVKSACAWDV